MTVILCHAAKGGVGTTFLAAQLALGAARRGRRVTAVDLTGQDSLKLHFGLLPNQFLPGFLTATREPLAIADVNLIDGYDEQRDPADTAAAVQELCNGSANEVVIVDIAAGDRALFDLLLPDADLHLSALLPEPASLASLTRLAREVPVSKMEKTALVLNQLEDRRKLSRHTHRFIREVFGDQLIATVRRDEAVPEALATFETLAKSAPQSVVLPDLEALADAVLARCDAPIVELDGAAGMDGHTAQRAG
ncbi:ATPase [Altererythrobacter sp. B11]|uniref:cellulose synthase operon protein YhjQ/BcsQ n=1 Tax=Altererythrobacter sp. B11 TaxID=2060312 RepID=UPI000DC6F492|nr:cellulose synthase operon protein YhjQ/BcsQ [Altererythrobacter sp. B11]BBC71897.1 ATPase [Altererythrobacter sp. B11]